MKALIYHGVKDVRVEEREIPLCGPDDVIVRNMRAGICGSDMTAYLHGGENMNIFSGREFGHEMVGYVWKKGEKVKGVEEGDRVFVEPIKAMLSPYEANMAGAFSQYTKVNHAEVGVNLYPLPENLSYEEAVLIEPLSVSTHAKNRAMVKPHEKVLVCGAGPIGLGVVAALRAQGNKTIAIIDKDEYRLKCARKMGAHPILSQSNNLERLKDELEAYFGVMKNRNHRVQFGEEDVDVTEHAVLDVDVVFDCAGMTAFIDEFLLHAKQYSRFCSVAVHRTAFPVRFHEVMSTQCAILGSRGYEAEDVKEVIEFLAAGKTNALYMVSHCIPLEDAKDAFQLASSQLETIKVILDME
ncbi:zinc-binding dehydrogenase [Anaerotignum sp.]